MSPALIPSLNASAHGAVVPIASYSLTSPNSNFFFTNIPQNYQDLYCVIYARSTYAGMSSNIYVDFSNSSGFDYGTNYSQTALSGNGSAASSARFSNISSISTGLMAGSFTAPYEYSTNILHILNYANTSSYKTILTRSANDQNGSGSTDLRVGLWRNTAALTGIQFGSDSQFAAGSYMTLYGVRSIGQ